MQIGKVSKFDKNKTEEEKKKLLEEEAIIEASKLGNKEYKKEQEMKEEMIKKYDQQIADETKELEVVRFELRKVKGPGAEDPNFHIDDNRDSRGHTYLMVASQNDDYITAEICLDLGADPTMSIKNDEGLSAIHYSHFFGFGKITDLIVQVRPTPDH